MSQSESAELKIAVTGANGYLGSCLGDYFAEQSYDVYKLTSRKSPGEKQVRFTLSEGVEKGFFADHKIDSLVHAAYDFTQVKREDIWKINVEGSKKLFKQAAEEGVGRIVFISTMSAYKNCKSLYGQAKLEIEAALNNLGIGVSIRPGLIYSTPLEKSGGMVGAMVKKLQQTSIMPLIGSGEQPLCLVHERDLAKLVDYYVKPENDLPPENYIIAANPRFYSFRSILENLAEATRGEKAKFIPIPWRGVWFGIKTAETIGLKLGFRSDSVLSLVHQNKEPDFSVLLPKGIVFKDFSSIIADVSNTDKKLI